MDGDGNEAYTLKGSWRDEVFVVNCATGEETSIWKQEPDPEHFAEMFCFSRCGLNLNFLTDEMKQVIAPTDTRLRGD